MAKKLNNFLEREFLLSFSKNFFDLRHFFEIFLNQENHLMVDARNFPNMDIKLCHPKEIASILPPELFTEYVSYTLTYDGGIVCYLFSDAEAEFFCIDESNKHTDFLEKTLKSEEECHSYLKAYENGLLKSAYVRAQETNEPTIFCINNGTVSLLNLNEAKELIKRFLFKKNNVNIDELLDDWEYIVTDGGVMGELVSILYINEEEDNYWYNILSPDYEYELFEKWGWK